VIETVLVLPSPPALLSPRSAEDPVVELRGACAVAVSTMPPGHRVVVLAAPVSEGNARRGVTEPLGHRVASDLLGGVPFEARLALPDMVPALLELAEPTTLVVMADGSARRGEKAPGHLHPDAVAFDERIEAALRSGDAEALAALDPEVGEELWCEGVPGLRVLGELARDRDVVPYVSYADAPYGVAWWVARWDLSHP
jgi:hypothetical protein